MNGFYSALVKQNELNDKLDAEANKELNKYNFIDLMRDKAHKILENNLNIGIEKVGIEKCEVLKDSKDNDFYECDIVVVLDQHFKDKENQLRKLSDECKTITHVNRTDLCLFLQNMLVVNKEMSFNAVNNLVSFRILLFC